MATTTPNYGWDVPTSTDYVKDGASAIETLGDDIDASLFSITGGKNVGLVHLATTTFSAASRVDFLNIFTTSYDNYIVEVDLTTVATTGQFGFRVGNSGTPVTTNSYNVSGYYNSINTNSGAFFANSIQSFGFISEITNAEGVVARSEIHSPRLAQPTTHMSQGFSTANTIFTYNMMGIIDNTTTYTDLYLLNTLGTITGTARVYGYRNS